jgi:hypothetical protein
MSIDLTMVEAWAALQAVLFSRKIGFGRRYNANSYCDIYALFQLEQIRSFYRGHSRRSGFYFLLFSRQLRQLIFFITFF